MCLNVGHGINHIFHLARAKARAIFDATNSFCLSAIFFYVIGRTLIMEIYRVPCKAARVLPCKVPGAALQSGDFLPPQGQF